jgi:hypothetical protein
MTVGNIWDDYAALPEVQFFAHYWWVLWLATLVLTCALAFEDTRRTLASEKRQRHERLAARRARLAQANAQQFGRTPKPWPPEYGESCGSPSPDGCVCLLNRGHDGPHKCALAQWASG